MRGLILDNFGFRATEEQEKASRTVADFLFSRDAEGVFVLRGYAGTGKTSIVGALVRSLVALKQKVVLMAPTGRAAKVFSLHAGHPAFTIHKRIYRQKAFSGEMTDFLQGVNLMHDALFIVDEASMIAGEASPGSVFGTGCLLDDLIHYVYSGEGCRLMLVGDTAQLPPVGVAESPALSADVLAGYGLHVTEATLTQVVRQLSASGILWNATQLRRIIASGATDAFPRLRLAGFADVVAVAVCVYESLSGIDASAAMSTAALGNFPAIGASLVNGNIAIIASLVAEGCARGKAMVVVHGDLTVYAIFRP